MYRIMIIEDDQTIAQVLQDTLSGWGYTVACTENFEAVMEEFTVLQPQLVLLDLSLPFRSGYHWCGEIRKTSQVPIIFISSSTDNMSMVTAIHQGGDDFITKPFDLQVLVAKVQALLRRTYDFGSEPETLSHRGAVLHLGDASLMADSVRIELTRNELRILEHLMENKGRIVSRDALMKKLWESESFVDDNTLTVNINRLRKKLQDAGLAEFIATKKGMGYYLPEGSSGI